MIELSATYYDGQTARRNAVTVRVDEGGVLHIEGLGSQVQCPLSEVKISPRLGNTVRSLRLPGGAVCETDQNDTVDAIERAAGRGRGNQILHQLESGWRFALLALLFVALVLVGGVKWGIPVLAKRVAMSLPDELVYDMGRGTLAALDGMLFKPSSVNIERQEDLQTQFAALREGYEGLPLTLHFRSGIGPNAFALPDGTVVVTDELVELARDDREILAVLAHEVGHVHHRHALRMAFETSVVALLASTYLGDVTQLGSVTASLPAIYANAKYSRDHETEADLLARETMLARGIPLHYFPDILQRISDAYGGAQKEDDALRYFSSHPATAERAALFQ